jgi:hypothetical protein
LIIPTYLKKSNMNNRPSNSAVHYPSIPLSKYR